MFVVSSELAIPEVEIELTAVRAQGAGGQNVNKVSSAIHLRFDIAKSSLPELYKQNLSLLKDRRISKDGVIIIKAQNFRTQEKNRQDALDRLRKLIRSAGIIPKKRKPTKPSKRSQQKRLERKALRSKIKKLRARVRD